MTWAANICSLYTDNGQGGFHSIVECSSNESLKTITLKNISSSTTAVKCTKSSCAGCTASGSNSTLASCQQNPVPVGVQINLAPGASATCSQTGVTVVTPTVTAVPTATPSPAGSTSTTSLRWIYNLNNANAGVCWASWAASSCNLQSQESGSPNHGLTCSTGDGSRHATSITNTTASAIPVYCAKYICTSPNQCSVNPNLSGYASCSQNWQRVGVQINLAPGATATCTESSISTTSGGTTTSPTLTPASSQQPTQPQTTTGSAITSLTWVRDAGDAGVCWTGWAGSSCTLLSHEGGGGQTDLTCSKGDGSARHTIVTNATNSPIGVYCAKYTCNQCSESQNSTHASCNLNRVMVGSPFNLSPGASATCTETGVTGQTGGTQPGATSAPQPTVPPVSGNQTGSVNWTVNNNGWRGVCWSAWAGSSCTYTAHEGGDETQSAFPVTCSAGDGSRQATSITNNSTTPQLFRCEQYTCNSCVNHPGTQMARCDAGLVPGAQKVTTELTLAPGCTATCSFSGVTDSCSTSPTVVPTSRPTQPASQPATPTPTLPACQWSEIALCSDNCSSPNYCKQMQTTTGLCWQCVAPAPTQSTIVGDLNNNGVLDYDDFLVFMGLYYSSSATDTSALLYQYANWLQGY